MQNTEFLKKLLTTPGPTGFEHRAAAVWADEAQKFAKVERDHYGNTYASINENAPFKVMLAGHIDEIGIMVSYINDEGFIYFSGLGGWDPQVLVGQRIRLMTQSGDLLGVIGSKPVHKMEAKDHYKVAQLENLWLDLGLSAEQVKAKVAIGDPGVIEQPFLDFGSGRFASKALDNRLGAFIVLEVLRVLKERGCPHQVIAVATAQEENGLRGAQLAAFKLRAHLGIAVDVAFAKQPDLDPKKINGVVMGNGTTVDFGPILNPKIGQELLKTAQKHQIKVQPTTSVRTTGTDGNKLAWSREGIPVAVVGPPIRYMHTPSEMAEFADIQATIDLMVNYLLELPENPDFIR